MHHFVAVALIYQTDPLFSPCSVCVASTVVLLKLLLQSLCCLLLSSGLFLTQNEIPPKKRRLTSIPSPHLN